MPLHRRPRVHFPDDNWCQSKKCLKITLKRPDLKGAVSRELRGKFVPERTRRAANRSGNAGLDEDGLCTCNPVDLTAHVDPDASSRIEVIF
jgi:hypothetical protein